MDTTRATHFEWPFCLREFHPSENLVANAHAGSIGRERGIAPQGPVLILNIHCAKADPLGQLQIHAAAEGEGCEASVVSERGMPFRILKRGFGHAKVRYRGLKKNHEWLLAAFALVNLYQHRNRLVPLGA